MLYHKLLQAVSSLVEVVRPPLITFDSRKDTTDLNYSVDKYTVTHTGTGSRGNTKTVYGKHTGAWYFEVLVNTRTNTFLFIGITRPDVGDSELGGIIDTWSYTGGSGNKYLEGDYTTYGDTYTDGDVIGVAFDLDNKTLEFYKNGVSQGQLNVGFDSTDKYYPAVGLQFSTSDSVTIRTHEDDFTQTIPNGFSAFDDGTKHYSYLNDDDKGTHAVVTSFGLEVENNVQSVTTWTSVRSLFGLSSGKWYWEVQPVVQDADATNGYHEYGVCSLSTNLDDRIGNSASGYGFFDKDGESYNNSTGTAYGSAWNTANRIQVALDLDNGKLWFGIDGTWQNSGDPAAGTNPAFTGLTGTLYPAISVFGDFLSNNKGKAAIKFNPDDFLHSAPSGFNSGFYLN